MTTQFEFSVEQNLVPSRHNSISHCHIVRRRQRVDLLRRDVKSHASRNFVCPVRVPW